MNALRNFIAAAFLSLGVFAQAQAGVVTFDSQSTNWPTGDVGDGKTYSEGGLTFTSNINLESSLRTWGTDSSANASHGGGVLFQNWGGATFTVTRTGGGSFLLNSFDFADIFNGGTVFTYSLGYVDSTGSHSLPISSDNVPGLQKFDFGLEVTSITVGGFLQFDNFVFDAASNTVPEPGSIALLGLGLAGLAAMRKRKQP